MRLPARLMGLVCLCLAPVVGVAIVTQDQLQRDRRADLATRAREQSELLNGTLEQMVSGSRAVQRAMVGAADISRSTAECMASLAGARHVTERYRWLAVVDAEGRLLCSDGQGAEVIAGWGPGWLSRGHDPGTGFWIGRYAALPSGGGVLPFFQRLQAEGGGARVLAAGLDLHWLAGELSDQLACCGGRSDRNREIAVADRSGTVLFRFPDSERGVGEAMPAELLPLVSAPEAGSALLQGFDGRKRIFGYVPASQEPLGLMVAVGLYTPDALADIHATFWRGAMLLGLSTVVALALAWGLGRRWIVRPTRLLMDAARRWRMGDYEARAPAMRTEFGLLASTFNDLADALREREAELCQHAYLLESRVEDRTRALSDTNNRLQVEIAERERTEVALHRAQKLQAVGQLAGGVAHEFNNLLATVLGNLELLERRLPPDEPRLKQWVERAMLAVQRGAQLTSRLLAFSRRQRLATGPTDLNALITDLSSLVISTIGRQIEVRTALGPHVWLATADRSQVEAAILNVVLNARDAMPAGGLLTIATANEDVPDGRDDLDAGQYVRVSISDTGAGMTSEIAARATEPFFTTKGPGSSGLGLSQAYGMMRQSAGALRIVSAPGHGTTVSLLFPRAAAQPAETVPQAGQIMGDLHHAVLLVDDDPDVRHVTAGMLAELGCTVAEFPSGPAALDALAQDRRHFDLALLDYAMPEMTGLDLAAELRARDPELKIVLVTGFAELADPRDRVDTLLSGVIRKPFTLRHLEQSVRAVLNGRSLVEA